jgi:photosystem II stability/assembly factor-like uncharacterized protein
MLSRFAIFLSFLALFLLTPAFLAAQGGPAYLIELDLRAMDQTALRSLEEAGGEHLSLAGRTAGTAFLHASGADLDLLSGLGIDYGLVARENIYRDYYIIDAAPGAEDAIEQSGAEVLLDRGTFYLVSVDPDAAFSIHQLGSKTRLVPAYEPAVLLRLSERALGEFPVEAAAFTYSPAVQSMVDEVSQTRLYNRLRELSGETSTTVGGENYTILTRYSPTDLCKVAGFYLLERFEALGLETEIHYFNFLRTLKSVYFPTGNQKGWCVGRSGTILHTENGGDVWEKQVSGLDIALNDVFMVDDYIGCIAANGGTILWTGDGGIWSQASTPTGADLNKVYMTDSNTGYCCGTGGVMLKSVDGGETWTSLSSGTGADLNAVVFVSSTEGWAVGAGGKIIHTVNGGGSWINVSSPTSDDLMDVTFASETDGWISTATGNVLKTEDGATWDEVSTPLSTSLRSVCFAPDGLTGWACGPDGGLVKSVDGGDSWADLSIFSEPVLWDVYFVDQNEGWMCGNAYMLHSLNGGADWDDQRNNIRDGDMNIIATKPGTVNPDEIYIICGHYDSTSNNPYNYAPGADDNGTGSLSALEAALVLMEYDYEATIRFVCFSREEQGLVGSNAYARFIAQRGDNVAGVINFDMIGYVDEVPEELEVLYDDQSVGLADAFGEAAALYVPGLDCRLRNSPGSRSSDHASFWDQGYAAFCGIEDAPPVNPYYHRTTDRVSTINFDFYENCVKAAVGALAELARIDSTSAGLPGTLAASPMKVLPNPCISGAKVEMAGRVSPGMTLEFYDVQGRLVGSVRPEVSGSRATADWDARDESGNPLGAGIYFVKVAGTSETQKIVLLQ